MKRLHILILIIGICLFLAAVALIGIPGITSSALSAQSWSGTWLTTWNEGDMAVRMVLIQSGTTVTGTYESNDGQITGTVQGNRLVGSWSEGNDAQGGPFELKMSSDGKMFAGWWTTEGTDLTEVKKEKPDWLGYRVS